MLKFGLMALALSAWVTLAHAKVECTKERFQFRGILSDSVLIYFKKMRNGDLAAGIVPHVYRTANICRKSSLNICLDIGGSMGPLFFAPKKIFEKNHKTRIWNNGSYIFKLRFNDNDIYIIDSYLGKSPTKKVHSFYYSIKYGLLSITYFFTKENIENQLYISDTYVSTCPGFLSLD